jgi:hypothetical protein
VLLLYSILRCAALQCGALYFTVLYFSSIKCPSKFRIEPLLRKREKCEVIIATNYYERTGSATYSAAHQFLRGLSMTSLEERTDTNVRLSILLNCRKALLAVLLRSVEKEGRERQRESSGGGRVYSALPSLMAAMLKPYKLHPTPIPTLVPGPVPDNSDVGSVPVSPRPVSVPVTPRPVSVPVTPRPSQAGTVPVPPASVVDPTPTPHLPTPLIPVELDRAPSKTPAEVGRDLVLFIRLMSFRGSPSYSTGLEFLSIDDVTAVGSQQKVITVDTILGKFLATILESDCHLERSSSAVVSSDVTVAECSVSTTEGDERTFLSAIRTALLHTLIATVSGEQSTVLYCTALPSLPYAPLPRLPPLSMYRISNPTAFPSAP